MYRTTIYRDGRSALRRQSYLILATLAEEPRHGYGIVQRIAVLSDGEVTVGPGTLYGALDRLTDLGLVAPDREEVRDGRRRRYYRLTDAGREALQGEVTRRRRDATIGTEALGGSW